MSLAEFITVPGVDLGLGMDRGQELGAAAARAAVP
jgi:hypothetical protein